ncbi:outer membrane protein transport protein [Ferrimonas futtsuensis]|uniref:outer membrane protein transport protein n=1 Tax=Ferrimonas futtsuensis TaxID=364764 RepID=UPI000425D61F|nr:outer membrane protein transport protein [Ferrimonas futtsuensis]
MKIRVVAALVAGALAGQVHAAGFQLAEYSATGLGRAFAGEAAIADNASAQGRNAALLMQLEGQQVSAGLIYVDPNIDVEGTTSIPAAGFSTSANADDVAPAQWVPNFYYSNRLSDDWAIGLALTSNYGFATELPDTHEAAIFGSDTQITTVELAPNVAYKLSDTLAVGLGLRIVYGDGKVEGTVPNWGPNFGLPAGAKLKSVEGDGVDWGYQLGMTWEPAKGHRIGLAYHSEVELKLEGDAEGLAFGMMPGQSKEGSLKLPLPAFAELSSVHQLTEALSVHGSINWTDWSAFEELVVDFPGEPSNLLKEENFKDNWRVALGATYQLDSQWLVRGGVALDKTAVDDEHRTLSIPDSDRLWFSFGAGYQASKDLTLDMSLTYIKSHGDAPITESVALSEQAVAVYEGEISGDVWLAGVQATYRF